MKRQTLLAPLVLAGGKGAATTLLEFNKGMAMKVWHVLCAAACTLVLTTGNLWGQSMIQMHPHAVEPAMSTGPVGSQAYYAEEDCNCNRGLLTGFFGSCQKSCCQKGACQKGCCQKPSCEAPCQKFSYPCQKTCAPKCCGSTCCPRPIMFNAIPCPKPCAPKCCAPVCQKGCCQKPSCCAPKCSAPVQKGCGGGQTCLLGGFIRIFHRSGCGGKCGGSYSGGYGGDCGCETYGDPSGMPPMPGMEGESPFQDDAAAYGPGALRSTSRASYRR